VRVRNPWFIALIACLILVATVATALLLLGWYVSRQQRIRIVRGGSGGGVLMAVDGDGLRYLNELYSLPKTCTKANVRAVRDPLVYVQLCNPASNLVPVTSQMVKKGVILIPQRTTAISVGQSFILPGGRLVQPYAANTFEMARDGAVEVERIRIMQPPNENLEGWVVEDFLGRVCCAMP
jgi:hypothetical protein